MCFLLVMPYANIKSAESSKQGLQLSLMNYDLITILCEVERFLPSFNYQSADLIGGAVASKPTQRSGVTMLIIVTNPIFFSSYCTSLCLEKAEIKIKATPFRLETIILSLARNDVFQPCTFKERSAMRERDRIFSNYLPIPGTRISSLSQKTRSIFFSFFSKRGN